MYNYLRKIDRACPVCILLREKRATFGYSKKIGRLFDGVASKGYKCGF
jgi:hypothetical protein